ncbi:YpfB family protein [Bacillus sp. P14.5]|uniref:YpfB family protein n=1 Tax=Bacillus sp. P14.5 TaxID=1983400 RepID=UPI001F053C5D|nr:YpfB family protein [Bacillus sp. P14.5]
MEDIEMRAIERIIIKLAIFHFILLLVIQVAFHAFHFLPEMNKLAFYEGVNKQDYTEIIEVLNNEP